MKEIAIFFTFDNGYVPQAGVTFQSLLENRKQDVFYHLFVVHSVITNENREKLLNLVGRHEQAELQFIELSCHLAKIKFDDNDFATQHAGAVFTKETLYRCIPDLIPEFEKYDKIIYSDVDIIVVQDISELWDIDLENYYLAGVKVPQFLYKERTHLPPKFEDKYFAGGLWIMNLKKMRKDSIGEKTMKIIKNPPVRLRWNDQDVMNLACDTNVKFISYKYISIPDWLPLLQNKNFTDAYYPNNELKETMYHPAIIHYAGRKPWRNPNTLKADLWYYWLEKSGFEDIYSQKFDEQARGVKKFKAVFVTLKLFLLLIISKKSRIFKSAKISRNYKKIGKCIGGET